MLPIERYLIRCILSDAPEGYIALNIFSLKYRAELKFSSEEILAFTRKILSERPFANFADAISKFCGFSDPTIRGKILSHLERRYGDDWGYFRHGQDFYFFKTDHPDVLEFDGTLMPREAYEEITTTCDRCEDTIYTEDTYGVMNGNDDDMTWCRHCYENYSYYHESDDTQRDYPPEEDDPGENILDYCARAPDHFDHMLAKGEKKRLIGGVDRTFYMGVELEVETHSYEGVRDAFEKVAPSLSNFALCKSDGSLSHGFEICTAPATLAAHRKLWQSFFKLRPHQFLKGWDSQGGLHVHVPNAAFSPIKARGGRTWSPHKGKFVRFITNPDNDEFMFAISGRPNLDDLNRWARFNPIDMKEVIKGTARQDSRYAAISLFTTTGCTLELRFFKSNLNPFGFFKVLEFVQAVYDYTSQCAYTPEALDHRSFLTWLQAKGRLQHFPCLARWLIKHEYLATDFTTHLPSAFRPSNNEFKFAA